MNEWVIHPKEEKGKHTYVYTFKHKSLVGFKTEMISIASNNIYIFNKPAKAGIHWTNKIYDVSKKELQPIIHPSMFMAFPCSVTWESNSIGGWKEEKANMYIPAKFGYLKRKEWPENISTSSANDLKTSKGTIHSGQSTASCDRKFHFFIWQLKWNYNFRYVN